YPKIEEPLVSSCICDSVNIIMCCIFFSVSETFTVSVKSHVSVQRGHTAILPCWLTFSQSAEDMEVRWYQGSDEYDTPVLLYKARTFDYSSQKPSYAGRVSFGLKEETSGGIKAGDVSLKLEKATIEDAGKYICLVSSFDDYDSASISLSVTETGHQPLLSAVMKDNNKVNLSCQSDGWHPKPELSWSDTKTALTPANVLFSKNSAGFYSVHSWVLVSSSSEVSCSVGLFNEEPKETRMRLKNSLVLESGSSSAGWVAFGILLVVLAAFGALYFLYFRKKVSAIKSKSGNDTTDGKKIMQTQNTTVKMTMTVKNCFRCKHHNCREFTCQNLHDKIRHQTLFYKSLCNILKQKPVMTVSRTGFTMEVLNHISKIFSFLTFLSSIMAVSSSTGSIQASFRGSPGFSSGQHYWEVSLAHGKFDLIKKSWWIGVTDKHEIPLDERLSPTTKNGFWFLSSCPNQEDTVQFSTEPETFIYVQSKPKTVGVYLDFENRELSFYNVEEKCLIGSLAAKFTGELFPLFNPGKGDIGT
uniref:Ig-like domain-containing protein n=1 Tax=Poecilia formosa TaxID=48698 RepID=A0A096M0L2_POEFO